MIKSLLPIIFLFPIITYANTDAAKIKIQADSFFQIKEYDQALEHYAKALSLNNKNKEWSESIENILGIIKTNNKRREYEKNNEIIRHFINQYESNVVSTHPDDYGKLLVFYALNLNRNQQSIQSKKIYEKAISLFKNNNIKNSFLVFSLKNAAQLYEKNLDYKKAIDYHQQALKHDTANVYKASVYSHLITNYSYLNQHQNAVESYYNGIKYVKNIKDKILINGNATQSFFELGEYDKTEKLAYENIELIKTNKQLGYTPYTEYKVLADLYNSQNNYDQSLKFHLLSIIAIRKELPFKDREVAKLESEAGDFYLSHNQLDSALAHYQRAIIQVFPRFNAMDIHDNPSLDAVYTESWIMTACAKKGAALLMRYQQSKDLQDLKSASISFDLSLAAIKELTDSYGNDIAKLYLSDYSHNYFEKAITVNYSLYKNTNEKIYLEKILSIMERSKASVLTEAIQKNKGLILAGIPDHLLLKEKEWRAEIAELKLSIKLEELYEAEADQDFIAKRQSQIADFQRQYETLILQLKDNYPAFRQFTETPLTPSIETLQTYLQEKQETFCEYFIGEKQVYLIIVHPNEVQVHQWDRSNFWDDQLSDFQDYFRNSQAIINDPDGFYAVATKLFNQIFPLDSLPPRLIIVPDESLNFIPFDALVKSMPESNDFRSADFLIKNHHIRYAYSGGLLLNPALVTAKQKQSLRIAPVFEKNERGLATLSSSRDVSANFDTLYGTAASIDAFRKLAAKYNVIEFFTHAGASESSIAPHIEFIDGALYLQELYAMNISAQLVVLSACETGLGKFEKGEGVMSLARGFAYAGARDLVASLWKVNERSTNAMINHFYTYLKEGSPISKALRLAKLRHLEEARNEAKLSPYYWAGFVSIGSDHEIEMQKGLEWHWWALLLVVPILFIIWRKLR